MSYGLDRKAQEDGLSLGFLFLLFVKGKGKQKVPPSAVQHSEMSSVPAEPLGCWGHFFPETSQPHHGEATHATAPNPLSFPIPDAESGSN